MHAAIVIADGVRGPISVEDQDRCFQEAGKTISKWVASHEMGIPCTVFASKQIANIPNGATLRIHSDARNLTTQLVELRRSLDDDESLVLIVIGHGHNAGYVDLMDKPMTNVVSQYQLTANDINQINPRWYFGLHCYALSLIEQLNQVVEAYGISGKEPAQNGHIYTLVNEDIDGPKEYKKAFGDFLNRVTAEAEKREMRQAILPWKNVNHQSAFVRHVNK